MLSYQHGFHAGNLADVHKHALLAWMLDYLCQKEKPLSYLETHAGRGLYDLSDAAALKTGEAAVGITKALANGWFKPGHPYIRALTAVRARHGQTFYPGSPLVAEYFMRPGDKMHLAELHPQEHNHLTGVIRSASVHHQDGFAMAQSLCPPTPRRGLLLIDPSFEVKADYDFLPGFIAGLHRKWNVGVIALWYPILTDLRHRPMLAGLASALPDALRHEVSFPPARDGHGMIGSGMFVVNPPFGLAVEAVRLTALFK